jgi:hypothetical protein
VSSFDIELDSIGLDTAEAFGATTLTRVFNGTIRQGSWVYGDGLDGDIHVNTNPFTLVDPLDATKNLITANVLQRDLGCATLTIDEGCALNLVRSAASSLYVIVCSGRLVNVGQINADGLNAAGFNAGGQVNGSFGGAARGGDGGVNAAGSTGSGVLGGLGGAGGAGSSGPGGSAGLYSPSIARSSSASMIYLALNAISANRFGGTGGGGGSGDGVNHGGGGGGGGPALFVLAADFDNSAGTITARGGNGSDGVAGNSGGGGAGGGGAIGIVTQTRTIPAPYTGTPPIEASNRFGTMIVTPGTHGNGVGTGTAGSAGTNGYVLLYYG